MATQGLFLYASHGVDRTLREHIDGLQAYIQRLVDRSMQSDDIAERNRLEAEIRAANLALAQFKAALSIEQTLQKR